jgi:hypothetical protein
MNLGQFNADEEMIRVYSTRFFAQADSMILTEFGWAVSRTSVFYGQARLMLLVA